MISAVIILTLLSLLVATEPEHDVSSTHPSPEPPLRPESKKADGGLVKSDRLAA